MGDRFGTRSQRPAIVRRPHHVSNSVHRVVKPAPRSSWHLKGSSKRLEHITVPGFLRLIVACIHSAEAVVDSMRTGVKEDTNPSWHVYAILGKSWDTATR